MIRIARSTDHILIASLNSEVQQLHHEMHPEIFKPFDKEGIEAAMQSFLADSNCNAFIAWKDEEPVGYMILMLRETGNNAFHYNTRSVYIDQIGVPVKNRKLGIGQLLMSHAGQFAKQHNITRLELDHWTANTVAANYFHKQGYTLCKERLVKQIE